MKKKQRALMPSPPPSLPRSPTHSLTAKADRLKEAKAEADREIAAFKATREDAYQRSLAEVRRDGRARGAWARLDFLQATFHSPTHTHSHNTQSTAASGEMADRLAALAAADVEAVEAKAAARAGAVVDTLLTHVTTVKAPPVGGGRG